jgi:hypothetical protein
MAMRFDSLGTREKVGLALAALAVFLLLVERLVVHAWMNSCRSIDGEIVICRRELGYQDGVRASQARVESAYQAIRGLLGSVGSADETLDGLKGEIDDLARRAGVSVVSMDHRAPVRTDATELYTVVVASFECDTPSLLKFLANVEETPGLLRVVKLSLSPGKTRHHVKGSMVITKLMVSSDLSAEG